MKLSLGFSPCPNDTFIFEAIVNKRIDTEGLDFEVIIKDIQDLNVMVQKTELDVSKLSYNAFASCIHKYNLMKCGSALGNKCGPILISKPNISLDSQSQVALPGPLTTASMLFDIFFPNFQNKKHILFSEIENEVISGNVDAGVIIHENRFTYEKNGLFKVADLGEMWEEKTKLPIPLGGIAVSRVLPKKIKMSIERVVRKSIDYAFENPHISAQYIKRYAQELDEHVILKHINLYVNDSTLSLKERDIKAIKHLLKIKHKKTDDIFI